MKKYRSLQISIDGKGWIFDYEGDTPQEVWEAVNDQGSKWIFYPIVVIVTNHPGQNFRYCKVISACDGFEMFEGKTVDTLLDYIKTEDQDLLLNYL